MALRSSGWQQEQSKAALLASCDGQEVVLGEMVHAAFIALRASLRASLQASG